MAVFTESERVEVWDRRQAGESNRSIGRRLGRSAGSIRAFVEASGGVRPAARRRSVRHLSLVEREEISRGVAAGESLRLLARRLGRAPSTLSREVARNGGRHRYRAHRADQAAWQRARRPQGCKLASNHALRAVVEELLVERWSPQQIAGRLRRTYPGDEEMHVSHETIYLTLFIQARGGLKRELTKHLRTRRANRRPKGARPPSGKGQMVDPVMISERPAAVEDRAVPGHWEGDLIMGKRQTAIGTLVERWSRYVMLFPLPDGHTAEAVRVALEATVQRLPAASLGVVDVGSRQRDGPTRTVHGRYRRPGLLLRPEVAVATRLEREHERAVASILPERHRPVRPYPGRSRCCCTLPQRSASTNPRMDDTIRQTRRSVAMTP